MHFINELGKIYIFYTPLFVLIHPIFIFSTLKYQIEFYITFNQRNKNISKWRLYDPKEV